MYMKYLEQHLVHRKHYHKRCCYYWRSLGGEEITVAQQSARLGSNPDCRVDYGALGKSLPSLCLSSLICSTCDMGLNESPHSYLGNSALSHGQTTQDTEGLGKKVAVINAVQRGQRGILQGFCLQAALLHTYKLASPSSPLKLGCRANPPVSGLAASLLRPPGGPPLHLTTSFLLIPLRAMRAALRRL